jgi:hypothetical protein
MKKIDLGQTITILANIGVIAGIVFLGVELRQTQDAMQAQAYQARAFDAIAWDFEVAKDENLRSVDWQLTFGGVPPESLSDSDKQIALYLMDTVRIDVDNEHYQYVNGFLDPEHYQNSTVSMIRLYAPIWRSLGFGEARSEFKAEVDRVLSEAQ